MVKLSDGREVAFDLNAISIKEYRRLFAADIGEAEEFAIMGKVLGMSADEFSALPYNDWRLVVKEFFAKARDPLENPT